MNASRLALVLAALLLSTLAAGCESPAPSSSTSERTPLAIPSVFTPPPGAPTYVPPIPTPTSTPLKVTPADYVIAQEYCAAVGTVDEFDSRYTGSALVMTLMQRRWRCVAGDLLVCSGGVAATPCMKQKRGLDPAYAGLCAQLGTGTFPSYAWIGETSLYVECKDGQPVIVGEKRLDARGFDADAWEVVPRATPTPTPAAPR